MQTGRSEGPTKSIPLILRVPRCQDSTGSLEKLLGVISRVKALRKRGDFFTAKQSNVP